jgi:hypothetical protein
MLSITRSEYPKKVIVMDDLQDSQESIVINFWERKEDMDYFINQIAMF